MRLPELAGVTRTIISSVKPIQRLLWLASIRPAGLSDARIVQPIRWAVSSARANATSGASPTVSGTTWISCCTFAPARAGVGFSMLPALRCRSCAGATPRCPVPIRPHRRFTGVHGWPDLGLTMKPDYVIERRAADHSANIGSRKHRFATDLYGSFSVKWFFGLCRFLVWSGKAVPRRLRSGSRSARKGVKGPKC